MSCEEASTSAGQEKITRVFGVESLLPLFGCIDEFLLQTTGQDLKTKDDITKSDQEEQHQQEEEEEEKEEEEEQEDSQQAEFGIDAFDVESFKKFNAPAFRPLNKGCQANINDATIDLKYFWCANPLCFKRRCRYFTNEEAKMNGEPEKMQVCGNCKHARYCSRQCQIIDWKRLPKERSHETLCPILEKLEQSADGKKALYDLTNKFFENNGVLKDGSVYSWWKKGDLTPVTRGCYVVNFASTKDVDIFIANDFSKNYYHLFTTQHIPINADNVPYLTERELEIPGANHYFNGVISRSCLQQVINGHLYTFLLIFVIQLSEEQGGGSICRQFRLSQGHSVPYTLQTYKEVNHMEEEQNRKNKNKKEPAWKKKKKRAHREKIGSIHGRKKVGEEQINFFVSPNVQHPGQEQSEDSEPEYVIQLL